MTELQSEKISIAAPLSFVGSAQRIKHKIKNFWLALPIIALAWVFVIGWYLIFGIFLIPYRLIRRSQRKNKKQEIQHREVLETIKNNQRL